MDEQVELLYLRCDKCKFWDKDNREQKRAGPLQVRKCTRPMQWWDATKWSVEPDPESEYEYLRTLVPEAADLKMFVQDGSDYHAELLTVADFFCAHFHQIDDDQCTVEAQE